MLGSRSPDALENHVNKNHLKVRPYICPHCGEEPGFYDRLSVKVHLHLFHRMPYGEGDYSGWVRQIIAEMKNPE